VTGGARARGIEAMGQNMLMFAGTTLALALGLIPALVLAGGVGLVVYQFVGWWAGLPAAVFFTLVAFAEAGVVVVLLGRVLERTDPSAVESADA